MSAREKSILENASQKPLLRLVRQSLEEILLTAPSGTDPGAARTTWCIARGRSITSLTTYAAS